VHAHAQHVARPSLPGFPTSNQIHRSSTSRGGKEVSPGPPSQARARRTSRSRSRKPASAAGGGHHPIPVQTCFPSASLPYASPELLRAPPSPPDFAQDIWALGIILHALLTSRLPFVDAFDPRLQMKIIRGEWAVPPGLGDEWVECLRGCLEVDPRRRWDVDQLAASDAVQGWQEAKTKGRSRSKSRSRSRSRARSRLNVSPTDLLIAGRPAGDHRTRSRSRNRTTDYFASAATVGSMGHGSTETPGTPRTGRTRSRSAASLFRDREHHPHYDSPLEALPEIDAVGTQDTMGVSDHQHAVTRSIARSPVRSSQARTPHVFGTGLIAGSASRGDSDFDNHHHPSAYRAPSSSSSSRNISSSRSRSRDQGTSAARYIPRASPATAPHSGAGLSTSPIQPLTANILKPVGDVPGPRTNEGGESSR
jgi:hypothetical protein